MAKIRIKNVSPQINLSTEEFSTDMTWNDMPLSSSTIGEVQNFENRLQQRTSLESSQPMAFGSKALFSGASQQDKSVAATLVGKDTNHKVVRVDTQEIVSKDISESEKDLDDLFNEAEQNDWILYFDKAEALSNQDDAPSYVKRRIETYPGNIILSSDGDLDSTIVDKLDSVIKF